MSKDKMHITDYFNALSSPEASKKYIESVGKKLESNNVIEMICCMPVMNPLITGETIDKPLDQRNPTRKECPLCEKEMWVSDLERERVQQNPDLPLICIPCGLRTYMMRKNPPHIGPHVTINTTDNLYVDCWPRT